jgi:hypothetical protein
MDGLRLALTRRYRATLSRWERETALPFRDRSPLPLGKGPGVRAKSWMETE